MKDTEKARRDKLAEEYAWKDFDKHHGSFINPAWQREFDAVAFGWDARDKDAQALADALCVAEARIMELDRSIGLSKSYYSLKVIGEALSQWRGQRGEKE